MGFLADQGALALGSRFKAISEQMYEAADRVYKAQGSVMQASWFPVLRLLSERGPMPVGDVAREIGQSHSAVSQLAKRLTAAGLLDSRGDRTDRRRRVLMLSPLGESELRALRPLWRVLTQTVQARIEQTGVDLLAALSVFETGLSEAPIDIEILQRHQAAARRSLRIVPWDPALRAHFYSLNVEWLQQHFYVEQIDHEVLSEPETRILAPGGTILFAVLDDEVVGTCALLQEAPGVYELTKMAVAGQHQGLGIGRRLLAATIEEFQRRGGHHLFLESNSKLNNALQLYTSMGFELQPNTRPDSHYSRADVYMIWREPDAPAPAVTPDSDPAQTQRTTASR